MMSIKRVILCAVFMCLTLSRSQNDFFVAKKHSSANYICVTNTSYALSWITEEMDETLIHESTYIPLRNSKGYDYSIKNDYITKQYFQKEHWSIEYNYGDLVLDERWEELKVTKTQAVKAHNSELIFYHVLNNLRDNFEVYFSVRIDQEGHIFLCDNKNPPESNCYWLLLQAYQNEETVIRKCGKNQIPEIQGEWPEEPCNIRRVYIDHSKVPRYLSSKKWSHFLLSKRENTLTFSEIVDFKEKTIMEWQDPGLTISVKNMIVHSKEVNGLWKIHLVDYIVTTEESNNVQLGPLIYPADGLICVSMYIAMCSSCKMKLSLGVDNVFIQEEVYDSQGPEWTQIKFLKHTKTTSGIKLLVSTIGSLRSAYWAIDKIRQCLPQEFRKSELSKAGACQLMSGTSNLISFKNASTPEKSNCSETTIGSFCVPCDWIFNTCERIKFCTQDECQCSAGYTGDACYNECGSQQYGHGCGKTCDNCYGNTCNNTNGHCHSKRYTNDYFGPKRDKPSSIVFVKKPKVIEVTLSSATIQMVDFEVLGWPSGQTLNNYIIQYKKVQDTEWMYLKTAFKFYNFSKITIVDLESDTKYLVRRVILLGDEWQLGNNLVSAEFTTLCQEISDRNILVETHDTSASISIVQITDVMCKSYLITIDHVGPPVFENGTFAYFKNLAPSTEYTVKIERQSFVLRETIETKGVSTADRKLTIKASSSTEVKLDWEKLEYIGSEVIKYIVEYQHIKYIDCPFNTSEPKKQSKQTTNTFATVNNLIPYSKYTFSVVALNTNQAPITQSFEMPPSNTIETEEIPKIYNTTTSFRGARIALVHPNCESSRGPILAEIMVNCLSEWCSEKTKMFKSQILTSNVIIIPINYLVNFTDYVLNVTFCRPDGPCSVSERITFKTQPAAPGPVRDLLVYTKNESSVSLRWKPPYPPNGILEGYTFRSKRPGSNDIATTVTTGIKPCKLWPQFHCETITYLRSNKYYEIGVSGRNKNVTDFGKITYNFTETRIEQSESPYDIHIKWTKENNLQLDWKHPNQTNGNVRFFRIYVTNTNKYGPKLIENKLEVSEDEYNLTYYHKVKATFLHPTALYYVYISANNGLEGKLTSRTTTTPPDIPSLSTNATFSSTDNNITVSSSVQEIRGQSNSLRMIILRSDKQTNVDLFQELQEFDLNNLKVVVHCDIKAMRDQSFNITVGSDQQSTYSHICEDIDNFPLDPETSYNISIVLINSFNGKSRSNVYSYSLSTTGEPVSGEGNSGLFALLILLLLIPLAAILYFKRDQLTSLKKSIFKENNSSTEVLEPDDDQIPLSHPTDTNITIQSTKKPPKILFKPDVAPSTTTPIHTKPIKIAEFEEYLKESIKNGELERQHALFPHGQTKPWKYGSMIENKSKNRYNNLIAYDHSRVMLQKIDDIPHSDYINASHINGHKTHKAYIATQWPKATTLHDFWRMIWQENVKHIANIANIYEGGKKKLEKYWPNINETLKFGDITIQHVSCTVFADYEHRVFTVTCKEETRKVEQLHFSSWPDHGVPLYPQSLVPFLQKMLQIPLSSKSPVVVHCSAGVGRTGTILLCDISLRMAAREGTIDMLRDLELLREQRVNMVDNIEQYKLAHLAVLDCLVGLHTSVPCNQISENVEKLITNGSLARQMEHLKDTQWQDQAMKTVAQTREEVLIVKEKNRFENIIPEIQGCVPISRYPPNDETSSYINAIKVDGVRNPGRFIVTQQPLPNTVGDFWRLIDEHSTATNTVIVSLNEINTKDRTCCSFWPTANQTQMDPVPHINLKHINTLPVESYDVITIHLRSNARKEFLPVQIISMKNWTPKINCPKSMEEFLAFWKESNSSAKRSSPIFVTCYDGVTASGLYVAMSFIIEKMKLEQVCDVCQAVRAIRHNRQQFIENVEQFEFLYKAAVLYIKEFGLC